MCRARVLAMDMRTDFYSRSCGQKHALFGCFEGFFDLCRIQITSFGKYALTPWRWSSPQGSPESSSKYRARLRPVRLERLDAGHANIVGFHGLEYGLSGGHRRDDENVSFNSQIDCKGVACHVMLHGTHVWRNLRASDIAVWQYSYRTVWI